MTALSQGTSLNHHRTTTPWQVECWMPCQLKLALQQKEDKNHYRIIPTQRKSFIKAPVPFHDKTTQ